jgi:hypothetical protein
MYAGYTTFKAETKLKAKNISIFWPMFGRIRIQGLDSNMYNFIFNF